MAEKRKRETLELESKIAIMNELENGQKQSFICKTRNLTNHILYFCFNWIKATSDKRDYF